MGLLRLIGAPSVRSTVMTLALGSVRHLGANPPHTEFSIQVVQPGLDVDRVPGWAAGETLLPFLVDAAGTVGAHVSVVGA
ncbi:hypothetical protein GCM10027062_33310 [Nocardioides hungaricus]